MMNRGRSASRRAARSPMKWGSGSRPIAWCTRRERRAYYRFAAKDRENGPAEEHASGQRQSVGGHSVVLLLFCSAALDACESGYGTVMSLVMPGQSSVRKGVTGSRVML